MISLWCGTYLKIRTDQIIRGFVSDLNLAAPAASSAVPIPAVAQDPVAPSASVSAPVPAAAPVGVYFSAGACDPVPVSAQIVAVPFVFDFVLFLLVVPFVEVLFDAVFVPRFVSVPLQVLIVDLVSS